MMMWHSDMRIELARYVARIMMVGLLTFALILQMRFSVRPCLKESSGWKLVNEFMKKIALKPV